MGGFLSKLNPTNLITGVLGSATGAASAAINAKQAAANRALQYKMFQEQNQFNAEQATLSYERNRNEWTRQFNAQNAYNDPSAQFQRNLNAGINPYAALGTFGNASTASASGATPASSASYPGTNMYPNNPVNDFLSGINQSMQSSLAVLDATKGMQTQQSAIDAINSGNQRDTLYNGFDIDMLGLRKENMEQLLKTQNAKNAYDQAYYAIKIANIPDIVANELAQLISTTQVLKQEVNEKFYSASERRLAYQYLLETFNERKKAIYLDNNIKRSTQKQIDNGIEVSNQLVENTIRETDSIINKNEKDIQATFASLAIQKFLAGEQAKLWRTQGNLNRANEYQIDLISSFGLPKSWRGLDLDNKHKELLNDYQQMFNGRYPILSAPTPEQWFNYMATDGGSVPAAALYGLGGAAAGVGNIIKPFTGFGFPKFKGKK